MFKRINFALIQLTLTDLPIRYSPRGRVPLTHSRTPALGVKGTTYCMRKTKIFINYFSINTSSLPNF